ncbi:hypothetical protein Y1Q_0017159 [Alligator mississippiensis]|uniref:Uncharacterized protein n=1 Tax=Alligator mississippiensis TaxID=8496 RepID=A0A151NZF1_ALLMI|nr:hypothetical protein Y1Q_0017159 [Alligator mississippiensis]
MRAAAQSLLRGLRRIVSFVVTVLFCDLLLRLGLLLLFFLCLPLFVAYDHLLPAAVAFLRATVPIVDAFVNRLLPAAAAFILSLLPPLVLFFGLKHLLLPLGLQLLQLLW